MYIFVDFDTVKNYRTLPLEGFAVKKDSDNVHK